MPTSNEAMHPAPNMITVPSGHEPGERKKFGGSRNEDFNDTLVDQASGSIWQGHPSWERKRQHQGVMGAMLGIAPQDEIEGMLAGQLLAAHNAVMECHRRATVEGQPFEIRQAELNVAGKLSRTFAALIEALDRHRGKAR